MERCSGGCSGRGVVVGGVVVDVVDVVRGGSSGRCSGRECNGGCSGRG